MIEKNRRIQRFTAHLWKRKGESDAFRKDAPHPWRDLERDLWPFVFSLKLSKISPAEKLKGVGLLFPAGDFSLPPGSAFGGEVEGGECARGDEGKGFNGAK